VRVRCFLMVVEIKMQVAQPAALEIVLIRIVSVEGGTRDFRFPTNVPNAYMVVPAHFYEAKKRSFYSVSRTTRTFVHSAVVHADRPSRYDIMDILTHPPAKTTPPARRGAGDRAGADRPDGEARGDRARGAVAVFGPGRVRCRTRDGHRRRSDRIARANIQA
jgi:hypothetical protein